MSEIERMTVTMPAEMAAAVKSAVDAGDYASTSEVVRAALRDWKMKRALQIEELAALKADIDAGLADVVAGRVKDFDAARIVERGRKLLADRSPPSNGRGGSRPCRNLVLRRRRSLGGNSDTPHRQDQARLRPAASLPPCSAGAGKLCARVARRFLRQLRHLLPAQRA